MCFLSYIIRSYWYTHNVFLTLFRLFAETDSGCILGASALGNKFIPTVEVGVKAANELVDSILGEYCVDPHTQDQVHFCWAILWHNDSIYLIILCIRQIIILMALAEGKSIVKCGPMTQHTETAIFIAEKLTNVSTSTFYSSMIINEYHLNFLFGFV